jgi:hypothetical protein
VGNVLTFRGWSAKIAMYLVVSRQLGFISLIQNIMTENDFGEENEQEGEDGDDHGGDGTPEV